MIKGVGDAELGEWVERSQRESGQLFVHVRRRVTPEEEAVCGPVVDVRGQPEMYRRLNVMALHTGMSVHAMARLETSL